MKEFEGKKMVVGKSKRNVQKQIEKNNKKDGNTHEASTIDNQSEYKLHFQNRAAQPRAPRVRGQGGEEAART